MENNPFEIARRQVDIAGKYLDLNPGILEMLKQHQEGGRRPFSGEDG